MQFLLRDADMHSAYLLRQRGWLCHSRYCIKTTKPVLKLFDHLVAHHLSIWDPLRQLHRYQIPRGMKNWRFSTEIAVYLDQKQCEIGRGLL